MKLFFSFAMHQESIFLWRRICQTLHEMLHDRGWKTFSWVADVDKLYDQFCRAQSLVFQILTVTGHPEEHRCIVCGGNRCRLVVVVCKEPNFTSPANLNIENLRYNSNHLLVLFRDKITVVHREEWLRFNTVRKIEVKSLSSLFINISKHRLVPRHRILNETEVQALLKSLFTTKDKLPRILLTDPVCRYYDFPIGSIIEIMRPDLYYRVVVPSIPKSNYEKFFFSK